MERHGRKEEDAGLRFDYRRFFLFLCLMLTLTAAGSLLGRCLTAPGKSAQTLTDWEYTADVDLKQLESVDQEWRTASVSDPVKRAPGDEYIFLRGTLPPSSHDLLCIRTANNPLRVLVDGELLCDTFRKQEGLTDQQVNAIPLPPSAEEREIEIIVYSPLSFSFSAFLMDQSAYPRDLSRIPFGEGILGAVLVLAGIGYALFLRLDRDEWSRVKTGYLLALTAGLTGLMLLAGALMSLVPVHTSAPLYKLEIALRILTLTTALLSVVYERLSWNESMEKLAGLNLLYALVILLWPYDVFLVFLIKATGILQIINTVCFVYVLVRCRVRIDPLSCAGAAALLLANMLYWQGRAGWFETDCAPAWLTADLLYIAGAGLALLLERRTARIRKRDEEAPPAPARNAAPERTPLSSALSDLSTAGEPIRPVGVSDPAEAEPLRVGTDGRLIMTQAMQRLVDEKCDGPYHHLLHVAEYTEILCYSMGFSAMRARRITDASLLHDIGKLCIPRDILFKTSALTDEEFQVIRKHHLYGYQILSGSGDEFLDLAARIALEHHEYINGGGYLGLCRNDICLEARIVAVADVFDALTSPRGYKKTWDFEQAFAYLQERSGEYFDERVIRSLVDARDQFQTVWQKNRDALAALSDPVE